MKLNFREPQKLFNRKVFSSFEVKRTDDSAHGGSNSDSKEKACNNGQILFNKNDKQLFFMIISILAFKLL